MNKPQKAAKPEVPMSVMDAIYHRRAVRNYTPGQLLKPSSASCSMPPSMLLLPCTKSQGHSPSFRIRPC
jgi:hypothetical protein